MLFAKFQNLIILLITDIIDASGWNFISLTGKEQKNALFNKSAQILSKVNRRFALIEGTSNFIGYLILLVISWFIGDNKISPNLIFIGTLISFICTTPFVFLYTIACEKGSRIIICLFKKRYYGLLCIHVLKLDHLTRRIHWILYG
jgi:hypothetical protein